MPHLHVGQGRSEVTEGGYDMDTLSADAAALIEAPGFVALPPRRDPRSPIP